jgi:hypothetical protein
LAQRVFVFYEVGTVVDSRVTQAYFKFVAFIVLIAEHIREVAKAIQIAADQSVSEGCIEVYIPTSRRIEIHCSWRISSGTSAKEPRVEEHGSTSAGLERNLTATTATTKLAEVTEECVWTTSCVDPSESVFCVSKGQLSLTARIFDQQEWSGLNGIIIPTACGEERYHNESYPPSHSFS